MSRFLEYKHTYFGETKVFDCTLAHIAEKELVLTFLPKQPMNFIGINFPVGSVSFGYFWEDRNYNAYHWKDELGNTILYYFNICRDTTFGKDRVDWFDLIVDVAATPGAPPKLLDLEEVPTNMRIEDVAIIGETAKLLVSDFERITSELERRTSDIRVQHPFSG